VTMRIFYPSERPDLDAAVILDCLQDRYHGRREARTLVQKGVYRNDRQVRELHLFHAIDRANPRSEIEVEALEPQQVPMPLPEPELAENPF
jgi:Holliday junction resolvase RusA-like endonuclease